MTLVFWHNPLITSNGTNQVEPGFALTFDDDTISEWYEIRPLLKNNNIKATFFISSKGNFSKTEIAMLQELIKDGHEIGVHGWSHENSIERLKYQNAADYVNDELIKLKEYLQHVEIETSSFAYVNGIRNKKLDKLVAEHFTHIRAVSESQRHVPVKNIQTVDDIYFEGRGEQTINSLCIDSLQKLSIEDFNFIFDRIAHNNEIVTFYAHKPVYKNTDLTWDVQIQFLQEIFDLANHFGLRSYLFREIPHA